MLINPTQLPPQAYRVLQKAVREFLAEGSIDAVTAMDLTLEGIEPDDALAYAERYKELKANG